MLRFGASGTFFLTRLGLWFMVYLVTGIYVHSIVNFSDLYSQPEAAKPDLGRKIYRV